MNTVVNSLVVDTRKLDNILKHLDKNAIDAMREWAEDAKEIAEILVPVDKGDLKQSIDIVGEGLELELTADAGHALFVENGTSKQSAQPFILPAVERTQKNLDKYFSKVIE